MVNNATKVATRANILQIISQISKNHGGLRCRFQPPGVRGCFATIFDACIEDGKFIVRGSRDGNPHEKNLLFQVPLASIAENRQSSFTQTAAEGFVLKWPGFAAAGTLLTFPRSSSTLG
jgi:hypothetical protein